MSLADRLRDLLGREYDPDEPEEPEEPDSQDEPCNEQDDEDDASVYPLW